MDKQTDEWTAREHNASTCHSGLVQLASITIWHVPLRCTTNTQCINQLNKFDWLINKLKAKCMINTSNSIVSCMCAKLLHKRYKQWHGSYATLYRVNTWFTRQKVATTTNICPIWEQQWTDDNWKHTTAAQARAHQLPSVWTVIECVSKQPDRYN